MSKPDISIVIINKNDRGVSATLAALTAIRSQRQLEIIVIDASSHRLDDIAADFPKVVWVPFTPKPHKLISIPEQRNLGVHTARADVVVFIDANCVPQPQWLARLTAPIFAGEENIVAGSTRSQRSAADSRGSQLHKGERYLRECPTINLAFKKSVFDSVGGFDERFDYGSDVDFSWRAISAGYKVRYIHGAQISHDWGNAAETVRRAYHYGVARCRLYKKHPRRCTELLTHDITVPAYAAYILGLPVTVWLPWYPLIILIPFVKNIRHHPLHTLRYHLVYAVGALRELVRI